MTYGRIVPGSPIRKVLGNGNSFDYEQVGTAKRRVAGSGSGKALIGGYDVTGVTYDLDASDPFNVGSVSFTVTKIDPGAGSATEVEINLDGSGDWFSCTESVGGSGDFTCAVGTVAVQ